MKHCKYSKAKVVRPYKVIQIIKRFDGIFIEEFFCKTEQGAKSLIALLSLDLPQPNEYYFGVEFKIEFIGFEKYV